MPVKTAYHPSGINAISFRESDHSYVDRFGVAYSSVTTIIDSYFPKFNKITVSEECSRNKSNEKYFGRDPADIRAEWKKESERGTSEGSNVHLYAELLISGQETILKPMSERCGLLFKQVDKVVSKLLKKYIFIAAELIVFSPEFSIAGTIDLVMYGPDENVVYIFDWKQNKEISKKNTFQSGLKPIHHLKDTDINHYSIQLSFYEFLLKTGGYFPENVRYKRSIIHLLPDRVKTIPLQDYNYEVNEILNDRG